MTLSLMFEISMLLTSVCGVLVAGWLTWRAGKQVDLQALAGFAIMMAVWCFGHVALFHGWPTFGVSLVLANPLMPTFFLHFAIVFVNTGAGKVGWLQQLHRGLLLVYGLSLLVVLHSWWVGAGEVSTSSSMAFFFVFTDSGWLNLTYTVLLGILAHGVLLYGWLCHTGNKRRSILAMFGVGAWGLLLASSFVFPSLGFNWFPVPMLLLPTYLLLLVYAVVRYQIRSANAFANRALLWMAMMLLVLCIIAVLSVISGRLGLQALANVPSWQLWLYSVVTLLVSTFLYKPLTKLVEHLIYPGLALSESLLESWSNQLKTANDWNQLIQMGERILSQQLGHPVGVALTSAQVFVSRTEAALQMQVVRTAAGWQSSLNGWQEVSPGQRLTAEVFGSLFVTRCGVLEYSLALAEAERKRVDEQHLVELGSLSAAMAHELRNPLNIISMASYSTDPETKKHIQTQLARADRLIQDMLIYSGGLSIQCAPVPVAPMVQMLISQMDWTNIDCQTELPAELTVFADPHRVQQVLVNLLDNASVFLRNGKNSRLRIEGERDVSTAQVVIRVHNNGPSLDESLDQEALFRPFVSKRPGGSGLGLAIVRRIMDAHGGRVKYRYDLGWPVTFELVFPETGLPDPHILVNQPIGKC